MSKKVCDSWFDREGFWSMNTSQTVQYLEKTVTIGGVDESDEKANNHELQALREEGYFGMCSSDAGTRCNW